MKMEENDNLKAAMANEAETTLKDLRVPATTNQEEGPADKQMLIRATEHDKERWKRAADEKGMTLSDFVRTVLNDASKELLDCSHPINHRRFYPWAEFCLKCNKRLRG
jgi:predicted DNA binding CopG/RHH family protein